MSDTERLTLEVIRGQQELLDRLLGMRRQVSNEVVRFQRVALSHHVPWLLSRVEQLEAENAKLRRRSIDRVFE